ncbi:MAG TPA: putative toxin-antitoxin system toxin component, PIN family [Acidisarcina sp.]
MLRVTADSNVILSALNFPGNPRRILKMAEAGIIRLAVSDAILNEVERVLRRPKFGWPEHEIARALQQTARLAHHFEPKEQIYVVKDDPTDNRILECATASASEYLVTGDKHLLNLGQYFGVKIITPAEFLEIQTGQRG